MIQHELQSRDGALDNIRLLAMKLVQGMGGSHLNSEGIHSKLDIMAKRWKHLQSLAVDRKEALEQALTEKQGFLSHLADCLAWLNQAEKHLKTQKPLGSDLTAVTKQQEIHQVRKECQVEYSHILPSPPFLCNSVYNSNVDPVD